MKKRTKKVWKRTAAMALAVAMAATTVTGCGNKSSAKLNDGSFKEVDASTLEFPLKEKATLTGNPCKY